MGHSVQVGLRLDHGLFTHSYRRQIILVSKWVYGISLLVASTYIMKWEMKHPAENQKGGEKNEMLKREKDVYHSHLW